ncbi:MAG: ASKHA domain-containing protein [Candidatus Hadarchaeales archaeon]
MVARINGREVRTQRESLLQHARRAGVRIRSLCGGMGLCKKCLVKVERGSELLSPPTHAEEEIDGIREGFRLACQAVVEEIGELEISVPPDSLEPEEVFLLPALGVKVKLEPAVRRSVVEKEGKILTRVLRYGRTIAEREVVGGMLGLALDVGTTNLVGYLVDLEQGKVLSAMGLPNPQAEKGEDLMTRLTLALQGENLREGLVEGINRLVAALAPSPEDVYEVVAVGNSVMHHFLFHLPLDSLARAPFSPSTLLPLERKAAELGLGLPHAWVYSPPPVGGFVGPDCVADVLSSGLWKRTEPWLLVDVGTNTEIVLSDGSRLFASSCASGPAFEGGGLVCGMRAGEGAISHVRLTESLEPILEVTGTPRGLCGSGALDLLSELLRMGAVRPDGRMTGSGPRFKLRGEPCFELAEGVILTSSDVRRLQLAKAAVAAGVSVLMEEAGVSARELSCLALAGAFGVSLRPESVFSTGMLPRVEKVIQLGHAAGLGAQLMLLSVEQRRAAEELARKIKHVQLAGREDFRENFIRLLRLEPLS